jgi:Amt family ammonium transporter
MNITSFFRALVLLVLCLFPLALNAQPVSSDVTSELRSEISRLQRDTIDLYKKLDQSGISPETLQEIRQLKAEQEKLQAALSEIDAEKLSAALADIKALQEKIAALPAASESAGSDPVLGVSINMVWVLLCGFLVLFMQAGFSMVETGLTRAKNAAHTMTMNLMDMCIGMLAFWAFGFAIMFGNAAPNDGLGIPEGTLSSALGITIGDKTYTFLGLSGWFLGGDQFYNGGIFALFLFQLAFAATANTICTGALAERWKLGPFTVASFVVTAFIYPLFGHWVWGGGWLYKLGYLDFAGSTVVHLCGGVVAFVGALIVGPRVGKFNADGSSNPIPGHNLPMAFVGTFILAFGWFGFNTGSTLLGTDAQIGIIATNTALASGAGAVAAFLLSAIRFGKPDPSFCCNGLLGGLVGITAPCAYVDAWAAVLIGLIAGALVVFSVAFVEDKCKIDDPVGAISVHGTCGIWGGLALGLFANGKYGDVTGLFYGKPSQLAIQALGVLVCILTVGILSYIMFLILEKTLGNAAGAAEQIEGLDLAETGIEAYAVDVALSHPPKIAPVSAAPVSAVVPPPGRG